MTDLDVHHKDHHWRGPAFAASDLPADCFATWGLTVARWGLREHQVGADAPVEPTASSELELRPLKGCKGRSCHGCTRAGLAFEQAGVAQAPAGAPEAAAAGQRPLGQASVLPAQSLTIPEAACRIEADGT